MTMFAHAVTTTVACQVSGGEGILTAEIDSRPYGLNGGRSQYFPGDTCYVLIYKSANVKILGSFVTGGEFVMDLDGKKNPGILTVREGLSFSTPVTQTSKPLPDKNNPVTVLAEHYDSCGKFQAVPGTNIARLEQWDAVGDPRVPPPHGFVFVEYDPVPIVGAFKNLPAPPKGTVFSWSVHAVIYGIAVPPSALIA